MLTHVLTTRQECEDFVRGCTVMGTGGGGSPARGLDKLVEALEDPYTAYLDPEAYELSLAGFEGRYEGIGAEVGVREGQITIIAPFADSPAAAAGIKAGDIILEIDGRPTSGMSPAEAAAFARNSSGQDVLYAVVTGPLAFDTLGMPTAYGPVLITIDPSTGEADPVGRDLSGQPSD